MTIREQVKLPGEISRFSKLEYMRVYRKKNRKRLNMYQKRYYHNHRDEILNKKLMTRYRRCLWCGLNIDHIKPRNVKFCNMEHGKLYQNKKKRDSWRRKHGSVSTVQDLQCTNLPVTKPPEDSTFAGGSDMQDIQTDQIRRDDRY